MLLRSKRKAGGRADFSSGSTVGGCQQNTGRRENQQAVAGVLFAERSEWQAPGGVLLAGGCEAWAGRVLDVCTVLRRVH